MSKKKKKEKEAPAEEEKQEDFWGQARAFGLAVLVALLIRGCVVEPFRIPSGSMFPTLLEGDHLFVSKLSYGPKVPFTNLRMPGFREPERGDIVVFSVGRSSKTAHGICPLDLCPKEHRAENFVKRLVGLPGDTVEVRDGKLYINGQWIEATPSGEKFIDANGRKLDLVKVDLEGCAHWTVDDPLQRGLNQDPYQIPEDRYFMVGDNRDHSNDSRSWGTVHLNHLKGPAFFMYWSWESPKSWWAWLNPVTWFDVFSSKMRTDRMGDRIRCGWPEDPPKKNAAGDD